MKRGLWNAANMISLARILLLFITFILLLSNIENLQIISLILTFIVLQLDYIDGYIARKYNISTKLGAVLDVTIDRIVENSFWVVLAYVGVFPLWAPLLVILRSFSTDAARSLALSKGKATFEFMHSRYGVALVASRSSRGLINISKTLTFLMGVYQYIYRLPSLETPLLMLVVWTVGFTLTRGILTIWDSKRILNDLK